MKNKKKTFFLYTCGKFAISAINHFNKLYLKKCKQKVKVLYTCGKFAISAINQMQKISENRISISKIRF